MVHNPLVVFYEKKTSKKLAQPTDAH